MIRKKLNQIIQERFEQSRAIFENKNEEYANNEEVFKNFKQGVGLSFNNTPEKYAWELLCKHLQSIKDILTDIENNKSITKELVDEKMSDAHNYLYLIEGMITEKQEDNGTWKTGSSS